MSEKKQHTSSAQNAGPLRDENPFLPLDDIVFAPVRALAASNANLSMSVLEEIRRMGTVKKQDGKDVLHLTNLNLAYERMHPCEDDAAYTEEIQMEVPLLSIIPIPNLKIKDAELDFSTEVLMSQDASGHAGATARICPSNEQSAAKRSTVNYKIRLKSADETEGYMRILDVLNLCPVAKQTEACPVSPDGRALPENKEAFLRTRLLKKQEAALCRLYQEIEAFAQAKENLSPDAAACCMNEDADDAEKYEAMKQSVAAELFTIKEALLNEKVNTILRGGNDLE